VAGPGEASADTPIAWVRSHLDVPRILSVATAVLILIALSVSWLGFVVIGALLAAYGLWLHRLGQTAPAADLVTSRAGSGATAAAVPASETGQAPVLEPASGRLDRRGALPAVGMTESSAG
jgi:hypothetical protein